MNVDILIIMAHPDDAELSCSGTILKSINQGLSVGIIDLTEGELGTRGSAKIRLDEANQSKKILGANFRDNLGLKDGFFSINESSLLLLIKKIRLYSPKIIITNSQKDRHPDHEEASKLVKKASFLSGLVKVRTELKGINQEPTRPIHLLYSIQNDYVKPDFIIDISNYYEKKLESIHCFKSQFYDPNSKEKESFISSKGFLNFIESRSVELGHSIGVKYGEGFTIESNLNIKSLKDII